MLVGLVSSEVSLSLSIDAHLLPTSSRVFLLCLCSNLFFLEDINYIGLKSTLTTSF